MLGINSILRRNRTILKQARPQGKITTYLQVLELAAFDFRYFTHLYRTGKTYYFCYDYGYLLLAEEKNAQRQLATLYGAGKGAITTVMISTEFLPCKHIPRTSRFLGNHKFL